MNPESILSGLDYAVLVRVGVRVNNLVDRSVVDIMVRNSVPPTIILFLSLGVGCWGNDGELMDPADPCVYYCRYMVVD